MRVGADMSTVMVVEDSQAAREVVSRILRREGYEVVSATNGAEALKLVHDRLPDLMLLDIMMPEMDGLALLSILRSDQRTRELPVILMTALSDEHRMQRARELGATAYLVKTRFSYDELLNQVGQNVRPQPIQ